jgi:hypothetical protein
MAQREEACTELEEYDDASKKLLEELDNASKTLQESSVSSTKAPGNVSSSSSPNSSKTMLVEPFIDMDHGTSEQKKNWGKKMDYQRDADLF